MIYFIYFKNLNYMYTLQMGSWDNNTNFLMGAFLIKLSY